MSLEDFNKYLDNLVISTTPVNPNASKDAVKEAENAVKEAKKDYKQTKGQPRDERIKALAKVDTAKEKFAQSKRDLVWFNYVSKKMISTKKALMKIYEKAKEDKEKKEGKQR